MSRGIYQIATGMMLEQKRQEHISRNLAGSNLPGFRGEHVIASSFKINLKQQMGDYDSDSAHFGVGAGKDVVDFSQGSLNSSGRSLDFAINGDGFFTVSDADQQPMYTRNGSFRINPDGLLVTHEGHAVQAQNNQTIKFNPTDQLNSLRVSQDGTLLVTGAEGERPLGRLLITTFEDNNVELKKLTASYFTGTEAAQPKQVDDAASQVLNNTLEGANVSPIQQMADMIQSLRQFETSHKMLKSAMEMTSRQKQSFGL